MTIERDIAEDVLGLAGTFPRPGWVVLDAMRERRFTGEVVFATNPEMRVYADRGRIYLAERPSDPSLGARLVDAGTLNAVQLEHGAMRVGDAEYLGRLFERVPSVDRHQVLVITELMTDECIGWLAPQRVSAIEAVPYRHHPSGVHRWDRPFADLAPGDPLPAPAPDEAPVAIAPPEPLFSPVDEDLGDVEDMIRWNEPSWLDEQLKPIDVAGRFAALRADDDEHVEPVAVEPGQDASRPEPDVEPTGDDWIDRIGTDGLPEPGSDPLSAPVRLSPLATEPMDRFELIWPSGDIDEQFGAQSTEPYPDPDIDRAGVTARLVGRGTRERTMTEPLGDVLTEGPVDQGFERWLSDEDERDAITDEVVLAVRRAVASIETGSLAARRRLAEVPVLGPPPMSLDIDVDSALGLAPSMPGRVAVRSDAVETTLPGTHTGRVSGSSVFDNLPPVDPMLTTSGPPDRGSAGDDTGGDEPQRASALRRLIGSLRRR